MPRKVHPIPSLTALTCLVLAAPAGAQVTADGTLGTTVTPSGATTYTITGGQFQGQRLYSKALVISLCLTPPIRPTLTSAMPAMAGRPMASMS
jgi:hypothetical protein